MPERHGILVSVIEPSEKTFTEYGVQDLGSSAAKSKICSVKIESKTDKVFQILVKPTIPFPFDKNETGVVNYAHYQSTPAAASSSSPPSTPENTRHPPFALSIAVYIDGNKRPDCTFSLPLDPAEPFYKAKGMIFRGRLEANEATTESVDTSSRLFKVRGWKWNNNGNIEDLLSDCNISAADTEADKTTDDIVFEDLANDFSLAAGMGNTSTTYDKAGVIRVVIKRIVILGPSHCRRLSGVGFHGKDGEDSSSSSSSSSGGGGGGNNNNNDDDSSSSSTTVEHITGTVDSPHTVNLRFMSWVPYKRREDFFAEFRFQYMARHKLVKLGLCREDGTPTFPMGRRLAGPGAEGAAGSSVTRSGNSSGNSNGSGNGSGKRAMGDDSGSGSGSGGNLVVRCGVPQHQHQHQHQQQTMFKKQKQKQEEQE